MYHEEHVWEASTKVDAIDMMVARRFRCVHITAFRAI